MKKVSTYRIFKEWKLIITYYAEEICIEDIKVLMGQLSKEPDYCPNYPVINDFRNCNLHITPDELKEYIQFLDKDLQIINKRRIGFLTERPNEVVVTHLFSDYIFSTSLHGRVFSTTNSLLKWLSIDYMDEKEFEDIVLEMKTEAYELYALFLPTLN
ncbi:hypothetical protein EMN47_13495 [Prolixibacteraceae bacterium JC049]|nr:hypothetical protein [Prolixibacteraceae bacterium JC049]